MTELRRTRSGVFTIDLAHDLDRLDHFRLVAMVDATRLPRVAVGGELVRRVRSGVQLAPELLNVPPENYERFQLIEGETRLVAIAHVENHRVVYDRVFVA
jgi:tRNA U55 pseudouridine synthase TruB